LGGRRPAALGILGPGPCRPLDGRRVVARGRRAPRPLRAGRRVGPTAEPAPRSGGPPAHGVAVPPRAGGAAPVLDEPPRRHARRRPPGGRGSDRAGGGAAPAPGTPPLARPRT